MSHNRPIAHSQRSLTISTTMATMISKSKPRTSRPTTMAAALTILSGSTKAIDARSYQSFIKSTITNLTTSGRIDPVEAVLVDPSFAATATPPTTSTRTSRWDYPPRAEIARRRVEIRTSWILMS